jgi:hypothetical protein
MTVTMTKGECEQTIRHHYHVCRDAEVPPNDQLSFCAFWSWLNQNHSAYLKFRTTTSVQYDIEMWFDQEFKLTWRR